MLRQRSSHLQNCKSARMSRRIAVEQRRYAAGMADTEGWQFETCWTTQELRMRIAFSTVRKKTFIFYYVTVSLYEQLLRRQNRYGEPLWSIRLNCQLMAKLEMMQILQAQVLLTCLSLCNTQARAVNLIHAVLCDDEGVTQARGC